jgi:hypothetical protein
VRRAIVSWGLPAVRLLTRTHDLGGARPALFAMGPGGHVAEFDYVRVSRPRR